MRTTRTILVLICITAIIDNQAYLHLGNHKAPPDQQLQTQCQTIGTRCQQDKPQNCKISPKGQAKAQQPFISYSLSVRRFDNAKVLVNKLWHSTLTTHTSVKVSCGRVVKWRSKYLRSGVGALRNAAARVDASC